MRACRESFFFLARAHHTNTLHSYARRLFTHTHTHTHTLHSYARRSVLTRHLYGGEQWPAKLLLGTSRAPCGGAASPPYAMLEIFSGGHDHAHLAQTGALQYYAAGGVTFVHSLGRDNNLASQAASLVVRSYTGQGGWAHFPYARMEDIVTAGGGWALAELPLVHAFQANQTPAGYWMRNVTSLGFTVRNPSKAAPLDVFVGHVVLVDSEGRETVLNDFEADEPAWTPPHRGSVEVVKDATLPQGKHALHLTMQGGSTGLFSRPLNPARPMPGIVDFRAFPLVRLYWRVGGGSACNSSDLFSVGTGPYVLPPGSEPPTTQYQSYADWDAQGMGPGGYSHGTWLPGEPYDISMLTPSHSPTTVAAWAAGNASAGDTLGAVGLQNLGSSGTLSWRTTLTLAEGPLVVIDALSVEASAPAAGYVGGPSFPLQVAPDPAPVAGAAQSLRALGFNLTGCLLTGAQAAPQAALLLSFFAFRGLQPAPLAVGFQRVPLVGSLAPATVAARLQGPLGPAPPTAPLLFISFLLPHDAAVDAAGLAAALSARALPGGALELEMPLPALGAGAPRATARVTLGSVMGEEAAPWSVTRSQA